MRMEVALDLVMLTAQNAADHDDCMEYHRRRLMEIKADVDSMRNAVLANEHDRSPVAVLHDSEHECDECGGPSPATSSQGCQWCHGQGDIVPRGTARRRTWTPGAVAR